MKGRDKKLQFLFSATLVLVLAGCVPEMFDGYNPQCSDGILYEEDHFEVIARMYLYDQRGIKAWAEETELSDHHDPDVFAKNAKLDMRYYVLVDKTVDVKTGKTSFKKAVKFLTVLVDSCGGAKVETR